MTSHADGSAIEARFEKSQSSLVLQSSDFSLQGLRDMVSAEIIDVSPKYQRRERWDVNRQSELIESFLTNIPVPPIYLSEDEYGTYSIIDGKQRITAVSDYLGNSYSLRGLSSFPELNGLRFRDLPRPLQNALKVRPFLRVITLLKQSEPELKYEVFLRLNRGGISLNAQEIRNVAFRGALNDAIYRSSGNTFLKKALNISDFKSKSYQQMTDAEWVLRFLTIRSNWKDFSGSFSKSMDKFMIRNAHVSEDRALQISRHFDMAIARVAELWGDVAFQRWDGERWRQQALAGLFDAQMISADMLTQSEYEALKAVPGRIKLATKKLFDDQSFEEAVRLGTNTPSRMTYRVSRTLEALRELI